MKYIKNIGILLLAICMHEACSEAKGKGTKEDFITENVDFAHKQINREIAVIEKNGEFINPVSLNADSTVSYCRYTDWRSGFFPGSVWYLYELTGDKKLLPLAEKYTQGIEAAKNNTYNHDVGFMIYCSFGNGYRLTGNPHYRDVILQAAHSLSTRFRPQAGVIQSWDVTRGWMSQHGWKCPVIIDNMMNLELLFAATHLSGDSLYYRMAVSHADRTLKEQFRKDGSCYHVVDYDPETGEVLHRHTAQGYSHESVWSRGQSWAVYGMTMCYRETGDKKYLEQAQKTADYMMNLPDLPADGIFYWDMKAPNIPHALRDASSSSIMASALYELSTMDVPRAEKYRKFADKMMNSLASPAYRAALGTNGNFLLKHSVGSIPHKAEIDVPINYADYYFLEALKRKRDINNNVHTNKI